MKRLIVNENKAQQDAEINKINSFIPAINNLIFKLKEDTGYDVSFQEILSAVFSSRPAAIHNMNVNMEAYLDKELDKAKITPTLMRNNHKAGFKDFIVTFCNAMKALSSKQGIEHLHNLSVVEGKLTLSEETEDSIRESFRNVIVSDPAMELWNLQNETAEKLQQIFTLIKSKTRLEYFNAAQLANDFFSLDYHTGKVSINMLDYERIQKRQG